MCYKTLQLLTGDTLYIVPQKSSLFPKRLKVFTDLSNVNIFKDATRIKKNQRFKSPWEQCTKVSLLNGKEIPIQTVSGVGYHLRYCS